MCIAAPGKVVSIHGRKATVRYLDCVQEALVGDEKVTVGDHVLVQMGIIVQVVSQEEAAKSEQVWHD